MKSSVDSGSLFHYFDRRSIERATLWVLAVGVLVAVCLSVAKYAVRDYRELQHEIHQPSENPTYAKQS